MIKKNSLIRAISLMLCLLLMLPAAVFAQQPAVDYSGHWAEREIKSFLEKGFISLNTDGSFKPDNPITRAEFAAIVNKAFGFKEKADSNFVDIKAEDAFYNDMAIAKKAGYLAGFPDGTVKPSGYMTRQEYAVIISRLLKLDVKKDIAAADKLKDAAKIPVWSKGAIGAAVKLGYMQGNPDNTFGPDGLITRGQAVAVLGRCYLDNVKVSYDKAGTYSAGNMEGSIAINAPDVTLENTVVAGNLIIGEGVGSGNAKLKNVTVKGDTIVRGGGSNSIIIEDCEFKNIIVIKADGKVRIVAVGKTAVEKVDMQSGGKLEEQDATGNGFGYVTIAEGIDPEEPIVLQGNFESVQVLADNANIDVAAGSIGKLEVAKSAENARINLSSGVTVTNMLLDAAATVTGAGKVEAAQVNAQGAVVAAPATNINTAPGVTVSKTVPGTPTTPTPAPAAPSTGGGGSGGGGGSNGGGNNDKPSITINSIPAQAVNIGSSVNVTVASVPADAVKSAVSSNTSVATVSVSGNMLKVTGVSAGASTITVTCNKSGYKSAGTTFKVNVSTAATPTADIKLALTVPAAGGGNSINVGGAVKTGTVKVINGTSSVVLTGTKTAAQTVAVSGADATAVTSAGTATAPAYTVNTADIAATGGIKEFTLTVSETGKNSITYNIKVAVAGLTPAEPLEKVGKPVLSAAGIAAWTDVADEEGYSVQLYKDGAVQGAAVKGAANQTSYDFSSVMKSIGAGLYTVKVTAIGDGFIYQDGPQSEASNGITQLAAVTSGLIWSGNVAHWTEVAGADSYDVYLYKDKTQLKKVNILTANAASGVDFSADMKENGAYTFKVVAKGDGLTKADAEISKASDEYVKDTPTGDMALELTVPAAGEGNSINVGGAVKTGMVKVVNGTSSVVLTGTKTAAQTVAVSGANATAVTSAGTATAPTYTVNTGDIAATGGIKEFTLTVSETGKGSITYNIKVTVAGLTPAEPLEKVGKPVLSAAGIAVWTDVANEDGYSVQLYKDGAVQGAAVKGAANQTSYDFSSVMKSIGAGLYTVKATAIGDGFVYQDGPQSEASDGITQLAAVTEGLIWTGDVAHWTEVAGADSYEVSLYKDGDVSDTINIPAVNAASGADFSADMTGDGTYTFKVAARGDGTTEADAELSPASAARVKDAATDRANLEADKAVLAIGLGANSALDNITTALGELPALLAKGTAVVWTSSKPGVVSDDGQTVTRPGWDDGDETVTMTAALTNGLATGTKTFKLVVKKEGTDQQKLDADKAALKIPLGSNTMENRIRYSLDPLPASLPYGTTVGWTSSDTTVMGNDGKILARPAEDKNVTMTATLTNGSATGTEKFDLIVRMKRPNSLSSPASSILDKSGEARWGDISNEVGYIVR
ncbi:MAG TPA: immunoglobulin-like domain-containing protein, partial [Clostridia bacterium]|nr:immunoglobulin-like domain-containing protein [Clostridia bacterium]